MYKKILIIILIIALNFLGIILISQTRFFTKKKIVRIGIPCPLNGDDRGNGQSMLNGIKLCLEMVQKQGWLKDIDIRLLPYNDKGNTRSGLQNAARIVQEDDVAIVLGHYYSASSLSAAEIYKKHGVPAITASATANRLCLENDWYFRIIPNSGFMGSFIAHFIKKRLGHKSATIIMQAGPYTKPMVQSFEDTARLLDIKIKKKWVLHVNTKNYHNELNNIIAELRTFDNPGMIFCATNARKGVEVLSSLKFPGSKYAIIGPDSFSNSSFVSFLQSYPSEQISPGYYSDGVYSLAPFLGDLAEKEAAVFKKAYWEKYKQEPNWIAAFYYDAAKTALIAINKAEVQGVDIRTDRRKIREALTRINSIDTAIDGAGGKIYFDRHGEARNIPAVGRFERQKLKPSFFQYQQLEQKTTKKSSLNKYGDLVVKIDDVVMTPSKIIYVGIDINAISSLNLHNHSFHADFYLWFRFKGKFNPRWIRFLNAVKPVKFGKPIIVEKKNGVVTQSYRIKHRFTSQFNLVSHPFDQQTLEISFRHKLRQHNKLMFVPDKSVQSKPRDNLMVNDASGWFVKKISLEHDVFIRKFKMKKKGLKYSRFTALLEIQRKEFDFIIRMLIPLLTLSLLIYMLYFLPPGYRGIRLTILGASVIVNAIYHFKITSVFVADYMLPAFILIYVLAGLGLILSCVGRSQADLAGRLLHPLAMVFIGIMMIYKYAPLKVLL